MRVPLYDLKGPIELLRSKLLSSFDDILSRQAFIMGEEVRTLEGKVADFCGAAYGVGVSSGTDALLMALMALGVGQGDEVIVPPFTFFATAGVVVRLGARPVFADINPRTFNLDPRCAEERVSSKTKVILPVHLYGRCADMEMFLDVTERRGCVVVEDAAQAIGARTMHGGAGTLGEAGCLSFYPTKNLGACGDAGMILTQNEELAERLRRLRIHGAPESSSYEEVGGNFRLDTLQAAVLLAKLDHLETWNQERVAAARRYDSLFLEASMDQDVLSAPEVPEEGHVFHQYVVRSPLRDLLKDFLQERGIGCGIYYGVPLHLQPCFQGLGYREGEFPEAERASREVLSLPIYPGISEEAQVLVVDTVKAFFDGNSH